MAAVDHLLACIAITDSALKGLVLISEDQSVSFHFHLNDNWSGSRGLILNFISDMYII